MNTLGQYIWDKWVPPPLRNSRGGKLFALVCVTFDVCADMLLRAAHAGIIASPLSPDDALPYAGKERGGLFKYPAETWDSYRARLLEAPVSWEFAGSDQSILGQLEAAGFVGATIITDDTALGPRGESAPYRSQFWIGIPAAYLETGTPKWGSIIWGAFSWGSGATINFDQMGLILMIVHKFKPSNQYFRGIIVT